MDHGQGGGFIDDQNVHGWAKRRFKPAHCHPSEGHIDPLRLAQHLAGRRRRPSVLTQVRIYRGRPSPTHQPTAAAANDRQTAARRSSPLVEVIRRPLRYPSGRPGTPAAEKGIDVALACDVVRLAMQKDYDVAILVSADTDLLPAIETVYDLNLAHIELAAWSGMHRLRFSGTELPWCHRVNEATFAALADTTDYTAP